MEFCADNLHLAGMLIRDRRMVERKKTNLLKARKKVSRPDVLVNPKSLLTRFIASMGQALIAMGYLAPAANCMHHLHYRPTRHGPVVEAREYSWT